MNWWKHLCDVCFIVHYCCHVDCVVVIVVCELVVVCRPDIIHCHDWPSAPVCYGDKGPSKSIFTIHNLNFGADLIGRAMQAAQVYGSPLLCM